MLTLADGVGSKFELCDRADAALAARKSADEGREGVEDATVKPFPAKGMKERQRSRSARLEKF